MRFLEAWLEEVEGKICKIDRINGRQDAFLIQDFMIKSDVIEDIVVRSSTFERRDILTSTYGEVCRRYKQLLKRNISDDYRTYQGFLSCPWHSKGKGGRVVHQSQSHEKSRGKPGLD